MAFSWQQGNTSSTPTFPKASGDFSWQKPHGAAIVQATIDAKSAQDTADQANSLSGIAKATISDLGSRVKDYAQESLATVPSVINAAKHPIDSLNKVTKGFTDPYMSGINKAGEGLAQTVVDPGVANKVAGVAKLISGTAEALFSPVSGIFNVAEHTPVLKNAADVLNVPFKATGDFGAYITGKAIDVIPDSVLPQASKEVIKAPLKEVGALAGQILLGGKIMEGVSNRVSEGRVITPEVAKEVVSEAHTEVNKIALEHPDAKHAALVPPEGVQPIKPQEFSWNKPEDMPLPPRDTGVTKTSADINENLVKQGFDALPAEQQAKYTPQSYTEIATHAKTLLDPNNIQSFKDMMTGKAPLSLEVQRNPEIYHNVLEAYATENLTPENVQLLQDLAKSPVSQTSRAAQVLGGHGFNDNPNSTVKALEEMNTELKTKIEKKSGKKYAQVEKPVIEEAKAAKNSVKVTPKTWEDFVESIKCNY